ncbi:MAG: twin-arginine translocase subunit TatB [Nitrosomonadales bacterium]|nr:twin-arginine translocase subunit TatB [Nitrosomonadales bacterium]
MFGVDFSEIMVIMVVALIVIGPERLPKVARTMGQWWGRMQRYVNRIKMDVTTSMELEELRDLERKVKAEAQALERTVQQTGNIMSSELRQLEQELEKSAPDSGNPAAPPEPPSPPKQT